jgi:hypothetical protein
MLGGVPAAQAVDAPHRDLQLDTLIEQVAVSNMTDTPVMNQRAGLSTAATARHHRWKWFEKECQVVF